jgi:hypothetical protein
VLALAFNASSMGSRTAPSRRGRSPLMALSMIRVAGSITEENAGNGVNHQCPSRLLSNRPSLRIIRDHAEPAVHP